MPADAGILAILWLSALIWFMLPLIQMYWRFEIGWHDVGLLRSVISGIIQESSAYSIEHRHSHFQVHFTPIFLAFGIYQELFPSLLAWIFLHASWMAVASVGVFASMELVSKSKGFGFLAYAAFLINAYVNRSNEALHFETLVFPTLIWATYFALTRRHGWSLLMLVLCLMTKQDMWLYAAAWTLLIAGRDNLRFAAMAASMALFYGLVICGSVYPYLYPVREDRFAKMWNYGATQSEAMRYLLYHPEIILKSITSGTANRVFQSILYLPLLAGWRIVGVLGIMGLWMSSTSRTYATLEFYYGAPVLALLFCALPFAIRTLQAVLQRFVGLLGPLRWVFAKRAVWVAGMLIGLVGMVQRIEPLVETLGHDDYLTVLQPQRELMVEIGQKQADKTGLVSFRFISYMPASRKHVPLFLGVKPFIQAESDPDFVVVDTAAFEPYVEPFEREAVADRLKGSGRFELRKEIGSMQYWEKRIERL